MKYILMALSCLTLLTGFAVSAKAQEPIAAVDMRKLIVSSAAGKSIQAALKTRQEAVRKEVDALEKKLRDDEQKLLQDRKTLKPEEFEAKKKAFQENLAKSRETIMKKSADLENKRKGALRKLQEQIAKVTADIADERKIKMVVDRELVVIVDQSLDLTEVALKKLDERVQTIPLE